MFRYRSAKKIVNNNDERSKSTLREIKCDALHAF